MRLLWGVVCDRWALDSKKPSFRNVPYVSLRSFWVLKLASLDFGNPG